MGSKPSERFSNANSREEYSNLGNLSQEKLSLKGNNVNNYIMKKKTARSNSTENTNNTMEHSKNIITLRNGRKKERTRIGDK